MHAENILSEVLAATGSITRHPDFRRVTSARGGGGGGGAEGLRAQKGDGQLSKLLFDWRHTFSSEAPRLTAAHFHAMTIPQMLSLLHIAMSLAPVSGSSHVASGVTNALVRQLHAMADEPYRTVTSGGSAGDGSPGKNQLNVAVETVVRLLKMRKFAARASRSNAAAMMDASMNERAFADCVTLLMKQLCAHFATANQMRQHSEQAAANKQQQEQHHVGGASATDAVDFFHDVALLRRVIIGFVSCFNHTACMPLFKQELLAELVRHLLFAVAYQARKEDSASKSRDGRADSVSLTAHRTEIIATLATVICRLRLYDAASLGFFQWAAPICIAEADLLSGLQLSFILEAYSAVGLHDPVLFMTLGQKAGELGELLRDDEVARVLNALGRTKIDHSRLRASLESSMRMKNIHRRATHSTALF